MRYFEGSSNGGALDDVADAIEPDDERTQVPMKRARVLIVADDPDTVVRLGAACGASASRVDHAFHTGGVLASFERGVDFAIVDLGMRSTDSVEMLRELASEADEFPPMVVLTERDADPRLKLIRSLGYRVLGGLDASSMHALELVTRTLGPTPDRETPRDYVFPVDECLQAVAAGQLFLAYQPQIRLEDGAVVGVEALVRWAHPRGRVVGPLSFVPALESSGHAASLSRFVLSRALQETARLRRGAMSMRVAVNISAAELADPQFVDTVVEALQVSGTRARDVCLEITESRLVPNDPVTAESLVRLRLLGVGLALDDFGTGFSTLAEMRRVPLSEIKLDQSYVRDMGRSSDARAIVEGVLRMADGMGAHVVAEGVEDAEVCSMLRRLGCATAQGFHFAKPMPAEALAAWLVARELMPSPYPSALLPV